jgi:nitrogen fixation NifU-like protein
MDEDLHELYQEIILSHNKRPHHYGVLQPHSHEAEGYNPLCGDQIRVTLRVEGDRVADVKFEASSCAICKAAASIMTDAIHGKTLEEAEAAFEEVKRILDPAAEGAPDLAEAGELAALAGVRKFPARIKCATLPWYTYRAALKGEGKAVTE